MKDDFMQKILNHPKMTLAGFPQAGSHIITVFHPHQWKNADVQELLT